MNKRLLSAIILLFISSAIYAQDSLRYEFGIKAGMGISSGTSNNSLATRRSQAALIGFWGKKNISKFSIQAEIYFLRSGVIFRDEQHNGENIVWFNSYNVPVLAGYRFGRKRFGAHVETGPAVSFITKHDQSFYFGALPYFVPKLNFGNRAYYWQGGGGVNYKRLSLDVRYSAGLNNVSAVNYNQKLYNLVASLGFRIL